jgi:hypothetical protein
MFTLSQKQIETIQKLYSLCFTMNQPEHDPLTDSATLTHLPDGRTKLEIDSIYPCDPKIGYYLYNLFEPNQKFEYENGNYRKLILGGDLDVLNFSVRMYMKAKERTNQISEIMVGGNKTTAGAIFNAYFDLYDLNQLLENNESFVEVIAAEIVNNINVSSKNITDGDEVLRLFQAEIQRSSTMSAFSKAFPELSQKLTLLVDSKSEVRIKQIEGSISQLKEVNRNMKKGGWFR